jgi:hypothetical protein
MVGEAPQSVGVCGQLKMQKEKLKIEEKTGGAVRFGTPGTAWDRLGTDKFFSPRTKLAEESPWRFEVLFGGYPTGSGSFRTGIMPGYAGSQNQPRSHETQPREGWDSTSAFAPKLWREKGVRNPPGRTKSNQKLALVFRRGLG